MKKVQKNQGFTANSTESKFEKMNTKSTFKNKGEYIDFEEIKDDEKD